MDTKTIRPQRQLSNNGHDDHLTLKTTMTTKATPVGTLVGTKRIVIRLGEDDARRLHRLSYEASKSQVVATALREFEERHPLVEYHVDNDI